MYNSVYTNLHFLSTFITCSHRITLRKQPLLLKLANIVTAGLPVPKLHHSFENLKAFYYFDMTRKEVPHLCTLSNVLLEPKLSNLTWKYINETDLFLSFFWLTRYWAGNEGG